MRLNRGDILWADLDPIRGREQRGRRPVLVISSREYLESIPDLVVTLPITSVSRRLLHHIPLEGAPTGLSQKSYVMTEQPRTVATERLAGSIGFASPQTMLQVDSWLADFLSLRPA